jgi:hypothetical protein
MKDRWEIDRFLTGFCDACCTLRLRASAVKSLSENGEESRRHRRFRVFRVFRGLKFPQPFGVRFPPFAFRFLDVYFVVKNFFNFIFGHRRSRLVTFGHVWSSFPRLHDSWFASLSACHSRFASGDNPTLSDAALAFRTAPIHYTTLFSTPLCGAFLT